jgi:ubiquinone/menaquinone biosynthesis C-methylase UbiE
VFLDWLAVPAGREWLDVGCGNGAFTERVTARCSPSRIVAVDPSEGQLAFARTRLRNPVVTFQTASAQDLPFADSTFDAAVMALVLSFIPNPAKAVAELARVVRAKGWTGAYMWYGKEMRHPIQPMYAALVSMGVTPPTMPSPEAANRDNMQSMWRAAGFESIETRVVTVQIEFADFDEFWRSNFVQVGPLGSAIAKLSQQEGEELKWRVREQLGQGQGPIAYEVSANAVKGRRA